MRKIKPYYKDKIDTARAFRAMRRWAKNPFSEYGAKQVPRIGYSLSGPEFHKMAREMRANKELNAILDKKEDLGLLLADKKSLGSLPKGTLGNIYNEFMSGENIVPGYVLGGLCYRDGHFDALIDWEDDAKYLAARVGNTHDLLHILSGYGTDITGEVLLIAYSVASNGMNKFMSIPLTFFWGLFGFFGLKPTVGFWNWMKLNKEASNRGSAVARQYKVAQIPFENLLSLPIDEARIKIGLPSFQFEEFVDANGKLKTSAWLGKDCLGRRMLKKYTGNKNESSASEVIKIVTLIENGCSVYEVFRAPDNTISKAYDLFCSGADFYQVKCKLENF